MQIHTHFFQQLSHCDLEKPSQNSSSMVDLRMRMSSHTNFFKSPNDFYHFQNVATNLIIFYYVGFDILRKKIPSFLFRERLQCCYIYFHCSYMYNFYNYLEPCALDAEFQHFIPRFNKTSLLCGPHSKRGQGVKRGPKTG